jgi:TRAP-type C4-dicarboxylate transport system substrate-binding protein
VKHIKLIATGLVALSVSGLATAQELKFASFVPPFHTVNASLIDKMAAGIAEATGGELTVRNYPGGELGAGPVEQYVRVVQGAADMSWGLPGYTSSQFKKTMIVELPNAIGGDAPGYEALWNAYDEHLAGEFPATKALALWTSEPAVFIMKEKVIRTPADLKGLKIRVAGATAGEVATAMGATPVQMPISQVYNSLQTGLIDGVITGASTLSDFKLDEVAASVTVGAPLGRLSFYAVMSQAVYDGLSADKQAAIDAASGLALSESAEIAWNATADAALAAAKASGENTIVELSADEAAAFAAALADVTDAYVADVGGAATLASMRGE